MTLANEALSREQFEDGLGMLTAIFAVLDVKSGSLSYASAGHEPPFIRRWDGAVEELDHIGRALGILPGFDYVEAGCTLGRGDHAILLTDGITEALDSRRDMLGREGVADYLAGSTPASIDDLARGILESARSFAGGPLRDDAAIVVFELA
jgi:sigma-B regulation protein RsbU (phosphoserine phosphatase)